MKDFALRDIDRARERTALALDRWRRLGGSRRHREAASQVERLWRDEISELARHRTPEDVARRRRRDEARRR